MCDVATQGILETIVKQQSAADAMFTALDITREAQHNHAVQYRHNDLKNDIHRIYADGMMANVGVQYVRTLIKVPGVVQPMWLYHQPNADISSYRSKYAPAPYTGPTVASGSTSAAPTKTASPANNPFQTISVPPLTKAAPAPAATALAATPVTAASTVASPAQQAAAALSDYKVSSRGRLWLPADILNKLGVKTGERVNVIKEGTSLLVAKDDGSGTAPVDKITDYLVDRHGNVALSSMCFKEVGIDGEDYYDVLEVNGKVVVKKV